MAIFAACLTLLVVTPGYALLLVFLFGMGVALGCDYPTAHMVISEALPTARRGRLVLGAFAFQAVGALTGTAVGYLILAGNPEVSAWRWMYGTAVLPALVVLLARFSVPESPHWLAASERTGEAETALARLLRRTPPYPKTVRLAPTPAGENDAGGTGYRALFAGRTRRATILASVPWFLQDLGTYGIGIFTPTILAATVGAQTEHPHTLAAVVHQDMQAARGAALIDVLLLAGIVCAVLLADRVGRIRLQVVGFLGCAVGLFLASLSVGVDGTAGTLLVFAGFMLFNFMTNLGPNAMTYLLAGEVFPTPVRGRGAGLAASAAKVGAVLTAFLFPVLLAGIGTQVLLIALVGTSLAGALVTWLFRIETRGVSLERV
jgi:MFS family permease